MVGIGWAWKVLFSFGWDEEPALAPVVLNCCCEHFPGHSLMCVGFSPLLLLQCLLVSAAGKCLFAEAFTLFSPSFPRTPLSLGVAEEADFIGVEVLLGCFFLSGLLFSCCFP